MQQCCVQYLLPSCHSFWHQQFSCTHYRQGSPAWSDARKLGMLLHAAWHCCCWHCGSQKCTMRHSISCKHSECLHRPHSTDVINRFCGQWACCCPGRSGIAYGPKTLVHSAAAAVSAGCSSYNSRCCPKATPVLSSQQQLSVSK